MSLSAPVHHATTILRTTDILAQVTVAIIVDILQKDYPHDQFFIDIFDDAPTHLKQADTGISARKMLLDTSKPDRNWLVDIPSLDGSGRQFYGPKGRS